MKEEGGQVDEGPRDRPLQFGVRTLLVIMVLVAVLFSTLGWLGLSVRAQVIILVVVAVSVLAAIGLVAAVAASSRRE